MPDLTTRKMPQALPMQTRLQSIGADAVNLEARTIQMVFTTGATVRRRRYEGWDTVVPFDETLVVSRAAINLERMNAGAPVLESHSTWSTYSQLAVVERAWVDGDEGWTTVRFPAAGVDERADRMFGMVAERIIKNVSVGYSIDKLRIVQPEKRDEVEHHIVERWTPYEVSFVTVGADAGAQVRSASVFPLEFDAPQNATAPALARMRMRQAAAGA